MNIIFKTCACALTPSIEMRSSIKFMSNFMIMISTNRFPISTPLAQACSLYPIHNSQFPPRPTYPICPICPTIHNSPPPLYFSIRLPSSSYLNVQPCHFFKRLTYCCFAPARHYPCLSSVLKRLPVLSLLCYCWLRSPKVAC